MRVTTLKAAKARLGGLLAYYAGLAEDRSRSGPARGPVDYYLDPNEPPGRSWGRGRHALGLDGEVTDVDPWRAMFNDAVATQFLHMWVAAFMLVGFTVAGVYAMGMLRGRRDRHHRMGFLVPFAFASVAAVTQPFIGHLLGQQVADRQPAKLAAFLEQAGLSAADLRGLPARALADMADAFGFVFVVATILVACCLIPAAFLPRSKPKQPVDAPALVGH